MSLLALLRCGHPKLSRIFTIGGKTYQVCLECGTELEYDLVNMRQLPAASNRLSERKKEKTC